jgi:hypothetical protein
MDCLAFTYCVQGLNGLFIEGLSPPNNSLFGGGDYHSSLFGDLNELFGGHNHCKYEHSACSDLQRRTPDAQHGGMMLYFISKEESVMCCAHITVKKVCHVLY